MNWISVKDRLPEDEKGCIYSKGVLAVDIEDGIIFFATYVKKFNSWHDYHEAPKGKIDPITHWMPLPKPPENVIL